MIKFIVLFLGLFFSGCATIGGYSDDISKFKSSIYHQNCEFKDEIKTISNDKLYNALKSGFKARSCKEYALSNKFFDIAESEYKYSVDTKSLTSKASSSISSTILNDNALSYSGKFYERGMINLYKALNFLALNDLANARVEFNRALARQNRAKIYFSTEILKAKNELSSKLSEANQNELEKISNSFDESLGSYEIYSNFINPFITYMAGIFFTTQGDKKGKELLKELDQNSQVKKDINLKNKQIWLIYENGTASGLKESRIDVPLWLASDRIYYAGFALPTLTRPNLSYKYLNLNSQKSVKISDMDAVIRAEYSKIYPLIITKEAIRAISKATLQYSTSQDDNPLGAIFAIYSALTTKADIRHIPVFPKEFQSVSMPNLGYAKISDDSGNLLFDIKTDPDKNTIIYLKSLTKSYLHYDKIEL
ncbi:hypothetical protein [Campylobacter corcagiensis]|uniref:Lipoprotein n=1 Tax=Campylobacter corcagiensis TaxID=1448857 RepID=A0A7M1LF61_9BACT|nr:hypothetical protein [Campylobacter corcagiensis]QKF65153.1 putative lipoprotein [Campylobacter corcagiensis]QOQ86704.1 hypothetical protein IMC76_05605 [Campylobacter corcagiensis]